LASSGLNQKNFWEQAKYSDSRTPLESWHDEVLKAIWTSPQAVKEQYGSASICANNRVVFNIGGNKYRLVVEMQYRANIAWVKFIGIEPCRSKATFDHPHPSPLPEGEGA